MYDVLIILPKSINNYITKTVFTINEYTSMRLNVTI